MNQNILQKFICFVCLEHQMIFSSTILENYPIRFFVIKTGTKLKENIIQIGKRLEYSKRWVSLAN